MNTNTIKLTWMLPIVRESGRDLHPAEIDRVEISMSADGGENFAHAGTVRHGDPQELTVSDLDVGVYVFRAVVYDGSDKPSRATEVSVLVEDVTPPGPVTEFIAEAL